MLIGRSVQIPHVGYMRYVVTLYIMLVFRYLLYITTYGIRALCGDPIYYVGVQIPLYHDIWDTCVVC